MTTKIFRHRGFPCCSCQKKWFPAFEAELVARGLPVPPIAQLIGGAAASASTHSRGGAADWWGVNVEVAATARMMGAPATWIRETGSFADNKHTHSVLRGCPHLHPSAQAQIREVDAGGDGLIGNAEDTHPLKDYLNQRTWQEGIAWHKAQRVRRRRLEKISKNKRNKEKWREWIQKASKRIKRLREKNRDAA